MIGVLAPASRHAVLSEFFELFKTPWEFCRPGCRYDVLLSIGDPEDAAPPAGLHVTYAGTRLPSDPAADATPLGRIEGGRRLSYQGMEVPVYGDAVALAGRGDAFLVDAASRAAVAFIERTDEGAFARIGYDLADEIETLLTAGQPASNAHIPALELHIAILRDLIIAAGVRVVEIPPAPKGYRFIACLTHDVDHPSIRRHRFDHTMFGFLRRAVVTSLANLLTGRGTPRQLARNWFAALKLPFVHAGLARDFWLDFDRYAALEDGARSTFFVIPFQDQPGMTASGPAPRLRAARYGVAKIARQVRRLQAAGCEVGLHGIDAWLDPARAKQELEEIRRLTGAGPIGVRMHWLYFNRQSPLVLDQAGADYDSTVGYNETIGFRAGATQAYKPLGAEWLLELPLHIMDTALFYPVYLGLSREQAWKRVAAVIEEAVRFGGVVTINWHDRSLFPERCWDDFYVRLLQELQDRGAWLAGASDAVAWFRKRRAATFNGGRGVPPPVAAADADMADRTPPLDVRISGGREKSRPETPPAAGFFKNSQGLAKRT